MDGESKPDLSVEALTRAHLAGLEETRVFIQQLFRLGPQGAADHMNMPLMGKLAAIAADPKMTPSVRADSLNLIGGVLAVRPELGNSNLEGIFGNIVAELERAPTRGELIGVAKAAHAAYDRMRFGHLSQG